MSEDKRTGADIGLGTEANTPSPKTELEHCTDILEDFAKAKPKGDEARRLRNHEAAIALIKYDAAAKAYKADIKQRLKAK